METDVHFSCCLFFPQRTLLTKSLLYRWDEWVPASRLLKMTETNIALQKSLQHTNVPSAQGGAASAKINPKILELRVMLVREWVQGRMVGQEGRKGVVKMFVPYPFSCSS